MENSGYLNITRFLQLNKLKKFPNQFIQIISPEEAEKNIREPHLHYYKLNHLLKREAIDLSLHYLNLAQANEKQLRKLAKIFEVEEKSLLASQYLVSNRDGEFAAFTINNENNKTYDIIKNFILGINKINTLRELNEMLYSIPDETITILTRDAEQKSLANKIIKMIYFENAEKFNSNTFNFLESKISPKSFALEGDEILIFLNKNIYNIDTDRLKHLSPVGREEEINNTNFLNISLVNGEIGNKINLQLKIEKYYPFFGSFYNYNESPSEEDKTEYYNSFTNADAILLKESEMSSEYTLDNDFVISLRLKIINSGDNQNGQKSRKGADQADITKTEKEKQRFYFEFISKLIKNLINIDNFSINSFAFQNDSNEASAAYSINNSLKNFYNVIKRINYSDSSDIAIFNKIKYFSNKDKVLLLYINYKNLAFTSGSEAEQDFQKVRSEINEMMEKLKVDFRDIKFLATSNAGIFNLFNLIPHRGENISIRFLDYSKYILFDSDLSGKYQILSCNKDEDLTAKIKDIDKNLIFNYKTNFSQFENQLNYENLNKFLTASSICDIRTDLPTIHSQVKPQPYLETVDAENLFYDQELTQGRIKTLTAENFKEKIIFDKNLSNLVLLTNNECNGCKKIESLLTDFVQQNSESNFNIYKYNTLNESYLFKKYRNVPAFVMIENGKIIQEIDLKRIIEQNQDHDAALKKVISKLLDKNDNKF